MKSMAMRFALMIALLMLASTAPAQVHFSFSANTGSNATVAVPLDANPNIAGTPLETGDEIGAFTPAGLCVGAVVWEGASTALTVWGDNDQTQEVDGMRANEPIAYRIWRKADSTEFDEVDVTYAQGDGIYATNGVYILASMTAQQPLSAPLLQAPEDQAAGVDTSLTLRWLAVSGADNYQLQVAGEPGFVALLVDEDELAGTEFTVSELGTNTTYYWRVRAHRNDSSSPWSEVRSFTTRAPTSVLELPGNPPASFALAQNYPNPFNPATSISYGIARAGRVELVIYNTLGQKVRTLVHEAQAAGSYSVSWDGRSDSGELAAGGVYIYTLSAEGFIQSRKLTLLK